VCAVLLAVPAAAFGQHYPSTVYTEQDGLPSSTVYDVLQDETGFLWIATRGGIARYDGAEWKTWSQGADLRDASFGDIALGSSGRLWAVSDVKPFHLVVYEDGAWSHVASISPGGLLPRDAAVALLVVRGPEADLPILVTAHGRILKWRGAERGWDVRRLEGYGPFERVHCAALDGDTLLVGGGNGLYRSPVDGSREPRAVPELTGRSVNGLARRSDGRGWWVAGGDWVGTWSGGRVEVWRDGIELCREPPSCPLAIESDPVEGLWVGSRIEAFRVKAPGEVRRVGAVNGLGSEGANALMLDRQHNLWLAAERALTKLRPAPVVSWDHEQGLLEDEVTSVLETRDGTIWLGHPRGLTRFEDGHPVQTVVLGADGRADRVMDLEQDALGRIWIATSRGGVHRREPDGRITRVELPGRPRSFATSSLLIREDGTVLVGGSAGLLRGDGDRFEPVDLPSKLSSQPPHVRRIVDAGPDGLLLPTVSDGLIRLHEGRALVYSGRPETRVNSVYTAIRDRDVLLAGSSRGLHRLTAEGGLEPAGPPDYPRVERPVYFLTHDRQGRLWIGTDNGALRWDGETSIDVSVQTGLLGHETNRDAGLADSRGRFWIGTNRGVSVYRDELESTPAAAPVVELARVELQGVARPADRPVRVTSRTAGLVASFHVLSFIDEERVRVESWLEGFDPQWQPPRPMARRELRYPRLEPGEYRLHLRATAADGRTGPATVSQPIVVDAPLWVTWWFRGGVAALLLGAALSGVMLVVQRRAASRLEQEVRRRTREVELSRLELQSEKETLSATLESAAEGILALDPLGQIVLVNSAAQRILEREPDRLRGTFLSDVFPGLAPDLRHREFGEAVMRGKAEAAVSGAFEARLGGELRAIEGSLAPIPGPSGHPHGAVFAFRDVTARRKLEQELIRAHKLESLGLLAGGIAHDFNNLLTVLIGNLALVQSSVGEDPRVTPLLGDMLRAGAQAKGLARQLLTFAQGGDPMLRPTDIGVVVEQARAVALSGTGVLVRVDLPEDLPRAHADPGQVSQVINNLLLNAAQAMGSRGEVRVRAWGVDAGAPDGLPDRAAVVLEVEDDGPGIPADQLSKIFDPYYSTKADGSGLGLAIAHSVMRRHGGRIAAESEPGRGARFRLVLPAETQRSSPSEAMGLAPDPAPQERHQPPRVLVMDDEPAIRRLIERLLERMGCEITTCEEGAAAVEIYRRALREGRRYALVITDLTVSTGLGGEETARELLELDPSAQVVVASGYSRNPVMADPGSYGFVDAIQKPFKPQELQELLRTLVFGDDRAPR
jgi:PAS domain S-box-containing protein